MTMEQEENQTPQGEEEPVAATEEWHGHANEAISYVHSHEGGLLPHVGVRGEAYDGPKPRPTDKELGLDTVPDLEQEADSAADE